MPRAPGAGRCSSYLAKLACSLPAFFRHSYGLILHSRHRPSSQRSSLGQEIPTIRPSLKHPLLFAPSTADLSYDSTLGCQAHKAIRATMRGLTLAPSVYFPLAAELLAPLVEVASRVILAKELALRSLFQWSLGAEVGRRTGRFGNELARACCGGCG
jgi:hypothetical protein